MDTANLQFEPLEEPIEISAQLGYVIFDIPQKGKRTKSMDNSFIDKIHSIESKKEI